MSLYSEITDTSCSDYKSELYEKRWTKLLLNWLNLCIHPKKAVSELNIKSIIEVMNKYKSDICADDVDRAVLSGNDIEAFIKYKYPILRLRYFWEEKDQPKKLFIMTTIILFHCCINSIEGAVDDDICQKLDPNEQELILKFCERLNEMEATIHNVECAVKDACESIKQEPLTYSQLDQNYTSKQSNDRPIKMPNERSSKYSTNSESCDQQSTALSSTNYESCDQQSTIQSMPSSKYSDNCEPYKQQSIVQSLRSSKYSNNSQSCDQSVLKPLKPSSNSVTSESSSPRQRLKKKFNNLKFKSSVTVLSSVLDSSSMYSTDMDYVVQYGSNLNVGKDNIQDDSRVVVQSATEDDRTDTEGFGVMKPVDSVVYEDMNPRCQPDCACSRCSATGPCCGDPGRSVLDCDVSSSFMKPPIKKERRLSRLRSKFNLKIFLVVVFLMGIIGVISWMPWNSIRKGTTALHEEYKAAYVQQPRIFQPNSYKCDKGLCNKILEPTNDKVYLSLSRCILLCSGPQLWPYPIGYTYFSKKLVPLATNRLEYKFQSVPSEAVHLYLAEAFKLFLGDLAKLERISAENTRENLTRDSMIKKMIIQMDIEQDPDPRLRLDTEESYTIRIETTNHVVNIHLNAASFCGLRHGLETLSQLILLDQKTGYLITLSHQVIKDAPSYKYRGLMLDTGRNFIPIPDIMRTIDGMASCKLNTFHWRISDVTSFPLALPQIPQLCDYGSYGKDYVYTKEDVKAVVKRAGIRGIRVLIEVAVPGPVGRAWSWHSEASCPTKDKNYTCNNILCLRLGIQDSVFDVLQTIYAEILDMTKVDDVFHLSDSVFSLANCYYLVEEREGFLDKALERLRIANRGMLPKMPIVWFTSHLSKDVEAKSWERFAVQLTEWVPNPSDQFLNRFKVIHSSRWDLSCEVRKQRCKKYRTWQEMYSWKSWRNIEVFTIEGGEAILWTDLVDSGNIDYHLWPRAAAVAERLWSDMALAGSLNGTIYVRLDNHRWRMVLKSIQVQPIWPLYCSFSPGICLQQLKNKNKK